MGFLSSVTLGDVRHALSMMVAIRAGTLFPNIINVLFLKYCISGRYIAGQSGRY